jgi:hypothetical protein
MILKGPNEGVQPIRGKNHRPQRRCIGCGCKEEKAHLVRVVATREGNIVWDQKQCREGRGAYLCPRLECIKLAVKRGSFRRAFRRNVEVSKGFRLEVGSYFYAKSQSF